MMIIVIFFLHKSSISIFNPLRLVQAHVYIDGNPEFYFVRGSAAWGDTGPNNPSLWKIRAERHARIRPTAAAGYFTPARFIHLRVRLVETIPAPPPAPADGLLGWCLWEAGIWPIIDISLAIFPWQWVERFVCQIPPPAPRCFSPSLPTELGGLGGLRRAPGAKFHGSIYSKCLF